jgi:hypothetical protein
MRCSAAAAARFARRSGLCVCTRRTTRKDLSLLCTHHSRKEKESASHYIIYTLNLYLRRKSFLGLVTKAAAAVADSRVTRRVKYARCRDGAAEIKHTQKGTPTSPTSSLALLHQHIRIGPVCILTRTPGVNSTCSQIN